MVHQLLPDVPTTIFRPAIVLGDSRRPETTQFDMVQAFDVLARLPVLPLRPDDRIDIVPANYVGKAIVSIHQKEAPAHGIYHLSSGAGSQTFRELTDALAARGENEQAHRIGRGWAVHFPEWWNGFRSAAARRAMARRC